MVPPLPAASMPSNTTTARSPVKSRACWMRTSFFWCAFTRRSLSSSLRSGSGGRDLSRIRLVAMPSEYQRLGLAHIGQLAHLLQHRGGDRAVDLDQRDRVLAGGGAAEREGRDVDLVVAQGAAEIADHARLVLVGDVEHVRSKLGIDADALDLHQARALFREQG